VRGVFGGPNSWKWTAPSFAVSLDPPTTSKPVYVELDFTLPEELLQGAADATVEAKVNGVVAGRKAYKKPDRYTLDFAVPPDALRTRPAAVEFTVDRTFNDTTNQRTAGLIVFSAGLKEREQTAEFREAEMPQSRAAYEEVLKQRDLKLPIEKQRELMRIFHDLDVWETLSFQGVRIIKNPLDLWMLQQIAWEVRPDVVIETGTWYGGSALYWAHTLNGMGLTNPAIRCGRSTWSSTWAAQPTRRSWRRWRPRPRACALSSIWIPTTP